MKKKYQIFLISFVFLTLTGLILGNVWSSKTQLKQSDSAKTLQTAWKNLKDLNSYQFSSTVEQITYPAPTIYNAGKSSSREIYYLNGKTDLDSESMLLKIWQQGGSVLSQEESIEINIIKGETYARYGDAEWVKLDQFDQNGFDLGQDSSSYLSAAINIRKLSTEIISIPDSDENIHQMNVTNYSFDIDSFLFAEMMRDAMIKELQQAGKLPIGMTLNLSDYYLSMVGTGEVWVNAQNIPVRLNINMEMPPLDNGEHVKTNISTDFFPDSSNTLQSGISSKISNFFSPIVFNHLKQALLSIGLFIFSLLSIFCLVRFTTQKVQMAIVAVVVILSMIISPIWQSNKVAAFSEEFSSSNALAQDSSEEETVNFQDNSLDTWDIHKGSQAAGSLISEYLLGINEKAVGFSAFLSSSLQPNSELIPDNDQDSDNDGLTDDYEDEFEDVTILNKNKFDTDEDGLSDGVEIKLALSPGLKDSDQDGIYDIDEITPFEFAGELWYPNPTNNDTDADGILDGAECPERGFKETNPNLGICRDTDGDSIPDIFDTDDDDDGVPSNVDNAPYFVSQQIFSDSSPFKFSISDDNNSTETYQAILDLQIRPEKEQHLSYIMNVFDWPNGDTQGQIMRVNDSTFADQLSTQQRSGDIKAGNGDMRLVPMVEIRIDEASVPLPNTNQMQINFDNTSWLRFIVESTEEEKISITPENDLGQVVNLYTAVGNCDEFSNLVEIGTFAAEGPYAAPIVDKSLKSVASGEVIFLAKNEIGSELGCVQPFAAHGTDLDTVIDTTKLTEFGAFVRNDTNQDILVYAPLTLENDLSGSAPVSFRTRVPFINESTRFSNNDYEIKMVWMLNMLTDVCLEQPDDYTGETWCSAEELNHWQVDISRNIHTYSDSFVVTGMNIIEDHGLEMDMIFQNPDSGLNLNDDSIMWGLMSGLEATFLSGDDGMTLNEIFHRFDYRVNSEISAEKRWNLPQDGFVVEEYSAEAEADLSSFVSFYLPYKLQQFYGNNLYNLESVLIIYARNLSQRVFSINTANTSMTDGELNLNFSDTEVITQSILNWTPYRWNETQWETFELENYKDLLEAKLKAADSAFLNNSEGYAQEDLDDILDGKIQMARITFDIFYRGMSVVTLIGDTRIMNSNSLRTDIEIGDDFEDNLEYQGITESVIGSFAEKLLDINKSNPVLAKFLGKSDTSFFKALKACFQSNDTEDALKKTSTLKKIGTAANSALTVGLFACAILSLPALEGVIGDYEATAISISIGLVSSAIAFKEMYDAVKSFAVGETITSATKKAGIVGAIIASAITWGIFFYSWGDGAFKNDLQRNDSIAEALAQTATIILMAALAATGIGAIVVAVIAILDALIEVICSAIGADDLEEDNFIREYVCIGISGWTTKIFKWFIYSQNYIIDYEDEDRVEFVGLETLLQDEAMGMVTGNHMEVKISIKDTITLSDRPIDWKSAVYPSHFTGEYAKTADFDYLVQLSDGEDYDIHEDMELLTDDTEINAWQVIEHGKWEKTFESESKDAYPLTLPAAGINRELSAFLSEGAAVPTQECYAISFYPICNVVPYTATIHNPLNKSLVFDIFPASLDDFYSLTPQGEYGYTFSWGRDAVLTFPVLRDADGDGLVSKAYPGGNDPNDSTYDSDHDGLSDYFEISQGTNPILFDSDNDGLRDLEEIQHHTDPLRKDTDGDGLTDEEELAGWLFTYDFESDGTPLQTMVYSNPLTPDADFDGITDLLEKVYGFNPNSPSDEKLLTYGLSTQEYDSPILMQQFENEVGSTRFADSSGLAFDGFCESEECPVSGLSGKFGNSVRFDGNQAITLPTTASAFDFENNAPFTLSGWINRYGGGTILSKWSDDPTAKKIFKLLINENGYLQLISEPTTITSTGFISTGVWTHFAVSFDGTTASFYLDGNAAGQFNWSYANNYSDSATAVPIRIGAVLNTQNEIINGFDGFLDEIAIFDHSLTQQEIQERLMQARYNFNDSFVRPSETITYQSLVKNLLNNRFAYGLLTTSIDKPEAIVATTDKFSPKTFVLYPDNPAVSGVNEVDLAETIQIQPSISSSMDVSINQSVTAQIVDRRAEANYAELWLKFNEGEQADSFEDSSGIMPPHEVTCSDCPVSGETGMLNQSITFSAADSQSVLLPDLSQLQMVQNSYTTILWVKPNSSGENGNTITLISSTNNTFGLSLVSNGTDWTPKVTHNDESFTPENPWRRITPEQWNLLILTYSKSNGTLSFYINGAKVSTISGVSMIPGNDTLSLGNVNQDAGFGLDDLRIFSRVLSTLDINQFADYPVLKLTMDSGFADSSSYQQPVSFPINSPTSTTQSVRGNAMVPGSGETQGNIFVNGNPMLDLSDGVFTISTWIYPQYSASETWQGIFGYRDLGTNIQAYPTLERKGDQLRFGYGTGDNYIELIIDDIITLNEWSHIVISLETNANNEYAFKIYKNGELAQSTIFEDGPFGGQSFLVGHSSKQFRFTPWELWMEENTSDPGSQVEVYVKFSIIKDFQLISQERYPSNEDDFFDLPDENDNDLVTFYNQPQLIGTTDNNEIFVFQVFEDDTVGYQSCGAIIKRWWEDEVSFGMVECTDAFKGQFSYKFERPSIQFIGGIDEFEIYRNALDEKQVRDLYQSIPINANLPLDDRPSSDRFENRSQIGISDDGQCNSGECPSAGTIGIINQAVQFDGEEDFISIPVDITSDYMISFWINTDCADCGVYSLKNETETLHALYTKAGNICSKSGSTEICSNKANIPDGQWHHIVYINNNGENQLWLDGEIKNTATGTALSSGSATAQAGFALSAENDYFSGQMDDLMVYRYSQPEIILNQLQKRAPIFLSHLDDDDLSDGVNDESPADWQLSCLDSDDPILNTCPKTGLSGRLGNGMEFDAQNDILSLTQTELSSDTKSFTVSVWVKPINELDSTQTLWTLYRPDNSDLKYGLAFVENSLNLCVLSTSDFICDADTSVPLIKNSWNMITLVVNRESDALETYQLYVNGYLQSTGTGNTDSLVSTGLGKLELGNQSSGSNPKGPFGGMMDEVAIYDYALNEIDIREIFRYQMEHVEESETLTLTIDADAPSLEFLSYKPEFPYLPESDILMTLKASDLTSGVAMVELTSQKQGSVTQNTNTVPLCDTPNEGDLYCPTINLTDGEGAYNIKFRLVDKVGTQSITQSYPFLVDGNGPRIVTDYFDGQLVNALKHPTLKNTWYLPISGNISDPMLIDGNLGSGLIGESITVTVLNETGEVIGNGTVKPNLTTSAMGLNWSVDYLFPEYEPTGALTIHVSGLDYVGNQTEKLTTILLDASAPTSVLDEDLLSSQDNIINLGSKFAWQETSILPQISISGFTSDIPNETLPYMTDDGYGAESGVNSVNVALSPAINASYQFNEPYPNDLLAWYPLDKEEVPLNEDGEQDPSLPQRTYLDISPFQVSGECEGDSCPGIATTSHKGGALTFNGDHQSINLGQNVNLGNQSFTISLWVKRAAINKTDPLLWQGPLSIPDQRFLFGFNQNNQLVCGFGGSDLVSEPIAGDTLWHYWACSFDISTGIRSLWKDGQLVTSDTSNPIPGMSENLYLGQAPLGSFSGNLDELIILNHALNASEIREQYTGYQSVYDLGLSQDFITAGEKIIDSSGFFNQVTLESKTNDPFNKSTVGVTGNFALVFDGDDKLVVDPSFNLDLDQGNFTQTAWVYPLQNLQEAGIFSDFSENTERRYPSVIIMPDQSIKVGFGNGYDWFELKTAAGVVPVNQWSFIAASFDGTDYCIYVNDQLILKSNQLSGLNPYPREQLEHGENLTGYLDQLSIFTRALDPIEIAAIYNRRWENAVTQTSGTGVQWQATIPYGLEGPYNLDVRAVDQFGHVLSNQGLITKWGGTIDSLPPNITITRQEPDPQNPYLLYYEFEVVDLFLDETSIHQNLCEGITLDKEYFNSSWYLAGGIAPNTALYKIHGSCFTDSRTNEETGITACDFAGNCSAETYPTVLPQSLYLPLIINGEAQAIHILPTQNPQLTTILEKSQNWAQISDSLMLEPDAPMPNAWIDHTTLTFQDIRSVAHINLHGKTEQGNSILQLDINIHKNNQILMNTQASLIGDVWNVIWPFTPGEPPENGVYQLELVIHDKAGRETTIWETITVNIRP